MEEAPLARAGAGAALDHEPTWGHRNGSSRTEAAPDPRSIRQKMPLKHQKPHMDIACAPGTISSC